MAFGRLEQPKEFSGSRPMGEINVTPLVDVMLVLVVIFILTAPLLASSIRLELPRADAARPMLGPAHVALSLDRTGQVFLGDEAVSLERLGQRLAALAAHNPGLEVQLRADALVPYGKVAQVMGVAQKSGLTRIGFVAEPE
jgi:biopolymer transport protein TolR